MITVEVDDLGAYWSKVAAKRLAEQSRRIAAPADRFPWREVHITDLGEVC
jgi:hypothetical protein